MLESLKRHLLRVGLLLNPGKTKVLTSVASPPAHLHLESGQEVEILGPTQTHRWLGRLLSAGPQSSVEDTQARLRAAAVAFGKHKRTLTCRQLPLRMRFRLFASTVVPAVAYGAGARCFSAEELRKLDAA